LLIVCNQVTIGYDFYDTEDIRYYFFISISVNTVPLQKSQNKHVNL